MVAWLTRRLANKLMAFTITFIDLHTTDNYLLSYSVPSQISWVIFLEASWNLQHADRRTIDHMRYIFKGRKKIKWSNCWLTQVGWGIYGPMHCATTRTDYSMYLICAKPIMNKCCIFLWLGHRGRTLNQIITLYIQWSGFENVVTRWPFCLGLNVLMGVLAKATTGW